MLARDEQMFRKTKLLVTSFVTAMLVIKLYEFYHIAVLEWMFQRHFNQKWCHSEFET